jgi:hypothetical protein
MGDGTVLNRLRQLGQEADAHDLGDNGDISRRSVAKARGRPGTPLGSSFPSAPRAFYSSDCRRMKPAMSGTANEYLPRLFL